jgi:hypothetical protein
MYPLSINSIKFIWNFRIFFCKLIVFYSFLVPETKKLHLADEKLWSVE